MNNSTQIVAEISKIQKLSNEIDTYVPEVTQFYAKADFTDVELLHKIDTKIDTIISNLYTIHEYTKKPSTSLIKEGLYNLAISLKNMHAVITHSSKSDETSNRNQKILNIARYMLSVCSLMP